MSDPIKQFNLEKSDNIKKQGQTESLTKLGLDFIVKTAPTKYSYNYTWMGRPIIAFPQDMIAMQEIIWEVKPDLIIETGVAHGGSVVFYASLLELLDNDGFVVGIDIDIRKHNRDQIESHKMAKRIKLLEGSSTSDKIIEEVRRLAAGKKSVLVCLDSNHSHEHVLRELEIYAPLTTIGSYCVVLDTVVQDLPPDWDFGDRPWGHDNNPKTAARQFLSTHPEFEINKSIDHKLLISAAPDGYLKRIK